ncbi:MAG: LysR family transcriptional regulator [Hyphomonadaceae bacterium]
MDWGDLKHFLAVARSGSTLAASRTLGVNQTTVARRIAALEDALGARLFERISGRYRLTELGAAVVPVAERVESEIDAFRREVEGRRSEGVRLLRVTTSEPLADLLLAPWLGEYTERFPDVQVHMILDDRRLDLERGEADIALRASHLLPEGDNLIVRTLCGEGKWAAYAGRSYVEKYGKPDTPDDLVRHVIIGAAGGLSDFEPEIWKRAIAAGARVQTSSTSISNIAGVIRRGQGVGPLPCMVGDLDPELVQCFMVDELTYQLILIMRAEMRTLPHVRGFVDLLIARTAALIDVIEGRRAPAA